MHEEVGALHTDIKPENVLLLPKRRGAKYRDRVKLVDLGTAFYVERQNARDIQTREYRCPEGILGIWPFTPAADVWSVGCGRPGSRAFFLYPAGVETGLWREGTIERVLGQPSDPLLECVFDPLKSPNRCSP